MSPEQRRRRAPQALLLAAALISGISATLSVFFYFSLYWPYRGLFDQEGRYFDEQNLVVHHEQSGLLFVPAIAFLALAILFGGVWWVRRRRVGSVTGEP